MTAFFVFEILISTKIGLKFYNQRSLQERNLCGMAESVYICKKKFAQKIIINSMSIASRLNFYFISRHPCR